MTRGVIVIDDFEVRHDVVLHWDAVGGQVLERTCSCGESWIHEQNSCPSADPGHDLWDKRSGDVVRLDEFYGDGPVVEHVTAVIPTEHADGAVTLSRVDGTIIGPRSIARPEALIDAIGEALDLGEQPCGVCGEAIVGNTREAPEDLRVSWCHVEVPVGIGHRAEPVQR